MTGPVHENPDHEALSQLAREDPEAFERLRRELVDDLIGRAPDGVRRRLEGLQFRLDAIHRHSGSALGKTVKVYRMMWDSFLNLRRELTTIREPARPAAERSAEVLSFRPRRQLPAA